MDDRDPVDFDHHSAAWVEDPYTRYRELREEHPLAWSESHGGFWLLSRYRDVRAALLDWETFSSAHPGRIAIPHTNPGSTPGIPIETDPPRHAAYRAAVAHQFSRAQVSKLEPQMVESAHALIDRFEGRVGCDLVRDYATPMLARSIQLMFSLPDEDMTRIEGWSDAVFGRRLVDPEGAKRAHHELAAYLRGALAERREEPRDDLFTRLVQLEVEGRPLSEDEQVGYARVLLLAGREATIDAIANSLWQLATHAEQRRALAADPAQLPTAVEELLRYHAPIQLLGRVATRDVELHGGTVRAGESVAMLYGSANRDEEVFEGAESCRIDRRRNPHLAFGGGHHYCLGAHLARLDIRVALGALLERIPEFELSTARPPERKPNGDARGFLSLEVVFGG
jgi:cytochrome P450